MHLSWYIYLYTCVYVFMFRGCKTYNLKFVMSLLFFEQVKISWGKWYPLLYLVRELFFLKKILKQGLTYPEAHLPF